MCDFEQNYSNKNDKNVPYERTVYMLLILNQFDSVLTVSFFIKTKTK